MAIFTKNGFNLEYPDEWEIEYEEDPGHELTLYSPNGAFWSLTRRPAFMEPDDLLKEALEALTAEYPEAEISTAFEEFPKQRLDGFDIDFFYLDLPCLAMIRSIRSGTFTYLLYVQTMDQSSTMMDEIRGISQFWAEHLDEMNMWGSF
ncbi:MAG: hypothetical protein E7028_04140 [Planctomycetaceae bacterium]|nr:hypothetical protein [Planctomycetaceae bacterium]MBQ2822910.1 hypothetical protein [Thermoguttaceae bacterium]MDO4425025.1 hypothetical protein [Planctomycetia bacterium]